MAPSDGMAAENASSNRHQCHCGKSFLRKEHLRRHQATHGERSHVCHICQRSFTRNSTPVISTRSWRACDACHENKTKCDGGDQCSLCMKRGIACTFDRALPATTKDDKLGSDGQATAADADMAEGINHNLAADRDIEKDACCARTCLKSILKAVSVPAYRGLVCDTPPPSEDLKAWIASCSAHYFGTFHERWTNIVHAPSFDQTTDDAFVVGSVLVIGAWLWDRENLGELVLDIHNRLVHRLLSLIIAPSRNSSDEKPWPWELYQASLLQVIFAFETGIPKVIQRARRLLGLLILALKDHGAFIPAMVSQHQLKHFPGDFKPWVHILRGKWKQLAYNILKVDVGISLFLDQAPLLHPEEIELSIPCTYALSNAHGIDNWFKRFPQEPVDREALPMSEVTCSTLVSLPSGLLVQDIQLGLFGLFGEIYKWAQLRRYQNAEIHPDYCRNDELQAQLDTWRIQLDSICGLWNDPVINASAIEYQMYAHIGKEDPNEEGWETAVSARMTRVFFNVSMLHSMLRLFLYTDLRSVFMFTTGTLDMGQLMTTASPPVDMQIRLQQWANSWKGRRAAITSLYVMKLYEKAPFSTPEQSMDPIAHMAVSVAAFILRCWITNSTDTCECGILPGQPSSALNLEVEVDKEQWALEGGVVVLDGMPLCHCALSIWMTRFETAIEERARGWEMSKIILGSLRRKPNVS